MRTTLNIDDAVLRLARQHAARMGLSLSGLVERALRAALSGSFRMPTYGSAGAGLQHEPRDFAEILQDDEATFLRSR